jgi:hypothetical protein
VTVEVATAAVADDSRTGDVSTSAGLAVLAVGAVGVLAAFRRR